MIAIEDQLSIGELDTTELLALSNELTAEEVLKLAIRRFGERLVLVTSFQASGMVIIDLATRISKKVRVVTIDTGRLHEETYSFMDEVRKHYGIDIEIHFPDSHDVRKLVSERGMNLFYNDVDSRQACCEVRKVHPLERLLEDVDGWVTGLRKDQSAFRAEVDKIELDFKHGGILKFNPLAEWTEADVKAYSRKNKVPQHPLYAKGYPSIGCEPCTRPIKNGEDSRSGRWWWEQDARKECGIHCRL